MFQCTVHSIHLNVIEQGGLMQYLLDATMKNGLMDDLQLAQFTNETQVPNHFALCCCPFFFLFWCKCCSI